MTTVENTARSPLSAQQQATAEFSVPRHAPPATRLLFALLARLAHGEVVLRTPDGLSHRFGSGHGHAGRADLAFNDWRVAREVLTGGDVAFAEAYMDGRWETPDLTALLTVLACNQQALERAFYGHAWQRTLFRLKHWLNANTRRQARRNIVAHYDLGNAFYGLWLDPTMTYSSALFGGDSTQSLAAAQEAKYARILDELALPRGAHILEIGCGWGGFAETAARAGYRVTGLSLSGAQTAFARARIARAGLGDRVLFRLQDYRDLRGTYDAVASIEMFEAVGERWWPDYFRAVAAALKPGGRAIIQSITIADALFERYRKGTDFIQQYIFPGGMLPSPSRFRAEAEGAGLAFADAHAFGPDYAETLRRWRASFMAQLPAVREQGFDERFLRMWEFYYCYCEASFDSGCTDVYQFELIKA